MQEQVKIGIIGGSGIYNFPEAKLIQSVDIDTPWGKPSDNLNIIEIAGKKVAFLARHGQGHIFLPSEVPFLANIAAMKSLGVEQIFAFSAVGSLKEELKPTHFVLIDQLIDRTKNRPSTFFGNGVVGHIGFADPFCSTNPDLIIKAAQQSNVVLHTHETAVCMEGPAFSTRAESNLYRSWGAGIINMTVLPEAKLAREAGICYNSICMVTDYDCWRESEEAVNTDMVLNFLKKNAQNAQNLLKNILMLSLERACSCHQAIDNAVMTSPDKQNIGQKEKLKFLYPKIFS